MKRTSLLISAVLLVSLMLPACLWAQSLGDVARRQRESKHAKAAKVVTNEDIGSSSGTDVPATTAAATGADEKKATAKKSDSTPEAAEVRAKASEAAQAKYTEQKKAIAQLEHDIDIMQREYKLRAAAYYADAGNSLRDPKAWAEQDRKYKTDFADKQKSLQEAKQKLTDFQEQVHKAGLQLKDE